jgi:hypothetical protein
MSTTICYLFLDVIFTPNQPIPTIILKLSGILLLILIFYLYIQMKLPKLTCSCGGGDGKDHPLGKGGCYRKLARGKLVPKNFRTINNIKACDVEGYTITEYTLLHQRCYHQHEDGRWSLPKDESSINSITMSD